MAGHSKWANIKHRKGAQDAKRAKIFSKLGREITVAAKLGGDDPGMNPRLRLAISTARGQSMPKDAIERAIQKGIGSGDSDNYEEMRYEGYAAGGVAIIVDTLTDNKNRTAGEVRAAFTKNGGNLGTTGSVSFMFDQIAEIVFPIDKASADDMFEAALEAGATNVESGDEYHEIHCSTEDFATVRDALEEKFGEPERQGLIWVPNVSTAVDEEQAASIMKLIDVLEDNDDVQKVTANFDVSDEIMEKLAAAGQGKCMRLLGIDPGLQKTGWGIIHSENNTLKYVASGLIKTNPKHDMSERLATLFHGLTAIIDEWKPVEAAIEETFVNKNPASALKLGQARGVLLMSPALKGISVSEYGANKVKKSVVGSGHANKDQMMMMVKTLLPACGTLSEDEADALAVAVTHAHYRVLSNSISGVAI